MKGVAIITAFAILVGLGIWVIWPSDSVEFHKRQWLAAAGELQGAKPNRSLLGQLRHELSRRLRGRPDFDQVMRRHESALFRLGYLTKHDLFLTNQVLTREFNSNFLVRLQQTFGTNGEAIWGYRSFTNRDGIHATLPAKDRTRWEEVFRECAERYASNLPPSAVQ